MRPMTYADLERLYLDGKISAKEYQKLLSQIQSAPGSVTAPQAQPATPQHQGSAPVAKSVSPGGAVPQNPPSTAGVQTNKDDKINDVEARMDALIRAKEAREKKAANTPPRAVAGPKTKRERLNDLLRLYIEGKVTEQEMNERRAKIVAEPD